MFAGFSDIFDSVPTWCATSPRPYITTNIFSIHIHNFTQILLKDVLVAAKAPTDLESSEQQSLTVLAAGLLTFV